MRPHPAGEARRRRPGPIRRMQPHLHDLGKVEVKHGMQVEVVNFYEDGIGNPAVPEKIRRAEEGRAALLTKQRRARHRRISIGILSAVIVLLGLGVGNWVWQRRAALTSAYNLSAAGVVEKSIAVLPFEYFGDDKDDAYLADGVQDDILTDLAKVADLKVISRRSVAQYRGSTTDVREIGKALQVAYVLEGTVRKVGGNLRGPHNSSIPALREKSGLRNTIASSLAFWRSKMRFPRQSPTSLRPF